MHCNSKCAWSTICLLKPGFNSSWPNLRRDQKYVNVIQMSMDLNLHCNQNLYQLRLHILSRQSTFLDYISNKIIFSRKKSLYRKFHHSIKVKRKKIVFLRNYVKNDNITLFGKKVILHCNILVDITWSKVITEFVNTDSSCFMLHKKKTHVLKEWKNISGITF